MFLLVCLCVQVFADVPGTAGWGEERVAEKAVSVRLKPDPASPLVRTLKPGDRVRVDFAQANGWVALFDMTEPLRDVNRAIGYAEAGQLVPASQYKPLAAGTAFKTSSAPVAKSETKGEVKSEVKSASAPQAGASAAGAKQEPVRITSDKMVYSQNENAVVFLGNVHGTQADMAIWAAKVTAYFTKEQKTGNKPAAEKGPGDLGGGDSKIERIVAEGDVRLVAGKNEGACSTLTYYVADGVLRMEGNPILREGQNTVRGDIIKYYMKENRSEVLSGAQRRVEAVFFSPKGDKK
ncbi:MAG TPA: LptA/OstA family protein [Humidesulfovibrio sp.]|uniref:LptA/OstA family protein n=1 Tax=Humidesulfovibrio sp. TaxID=2910988 RepID=UPI002B51DE28|nr:LptA/OstA family protein [Humidesulfovibrio sp.]HWR02937.1 LptA/OstA family protein [Humidesulfovibrio sp.]